MVNRFICFSAGQYDYRKAWYGKGGVRGIGKGRMRGGLRPTRERMECLRGEAPARLPRE